MNADKDMIEIKSKRTVDAAGLVTFSPPTDVTVQDCHINGSMRIYGMATNGQGVDLKASSQLNGHVERARANAPTRITLENLFIVANSRIPLYISPGVTFVRLPESRAKGPPSRGFVLPGPWNAISTSLGAHLRPPNALLNTLVCESGAPECALQRVGMWIRGPRMRSSTCCDRLAVISFVFWRASCAPVASILLC